MKKYNSILIAIFILLIIGISSCEKDDLCDPSLSVTPRLIITFVDIADPEDRKTVDELQLQAIGSSEFAPLNSSGAQLLIDVDSIAIPLRTDDVTTTYSFIKTDGTGTNADLVEFNYSLSETYINRACGFKVTYDNLGAIRLPEITNDEWINNVRVLTENVTSNNDIHIEIRH
ncbi:MAG: DUF6452 family protein [Nonlabens sp.]|uniref:DUF6452 family protein n=1 Tax=Nonlabens sp. TaxID=1888209 RepID=UPI003EF983E5